MIAYKMYENNIIFSISELPVATRHHRDMTEKLLKATLNPNTHTHSSISENVMHHFWKSKILFISLKICIFQRRMGITVMKIVIWGRFKTKFPTTKMDDLHLQMTILSAVIP